MNEKSHLSEYELYALQTLPHHLSRTEQETRLKQLLHSFKFLQAKVDFLDPQSLIDDYYLLQSGSSNLVQEALQLGSHILQTDRTQLASQLIGRLLSSEQAVQTLLQEAKGYRAKSWLCPLQPTLHSPAQALRRTLEHWPKVVNAVAITGDNGLIIYTLSQSVIVWNVTEEREVAVLNGHTDIVYDIVLTKDEKFIISASADKTIRVWSLEDAVHLYTLEGHDDTVWQVEISADGKSIYSVSADKSVKFWAIEDGTELFSFRDLTTNVDKIMPTPDGQFLLLTSSEDNSVVKVWHLEQQSEFSALPAHERGVNDIVVTSDGRRAITASEDGKIREWKLDSKELLFEIDAGSGGAGVNVLALTHDGKYLVSAGDDLLVKQWLLESGEHVQTFPGHRNTVTAIAVSQDRSKLITGGYDCTVRIWDVNRQPAPDANWNDSVTDLVITPDDQYALSATHSGQIVLWHVRSGQQQHLFEGHMSRVNCITCFPYQPWFVSADVQGVIKIWNMYSRHERMTLKAHEMGITALTITPDGQKIISASGDATIKIWQAESGDLVHTLLGHQQTIHTAILTADGQKIISTSEDKMIKVWEVESGKILYTLTSHDEAVNEVAVTSDSKQLVSIGLDQQLKIWDLDQGIERHSLTCSVMLTSPVVIPGAYQMALAVDEEIKILDIARGTLRTLVADAHTLTINKLALSDDKRYLVSVADDAAIKVWQLQDGKAVAQFIADWDVELCAITADNRYIVTADERCQINFFHLVLSIKE